MTATADLIIERHRVRRKLTFWRIAAIVAVVVAIIALMPGWPRTTGDHIARIHVDEIIFHEPARERMLLELVDDTSVKAVIVAIDSPGGTLVGSEALYEAIRKIAAKKPVVATMAEYAASGGYITALATDRIFARQNTLTGSIGVVMEAPNIAGLLEMIGIEVTRIKSGPLKAEPSYTSSPTPEVLRAEEELIADAFGWFKGLVEDRRGLTGEALERVTDGRAHTGRQALALGLIDEIGDEAAARAWLASEREIEADLKVVDHDWRVDDAPWPLDELTEASEAISRAARLNSASPRLFAIIQ